MTSIEAGNAVAEGFRRVDPDAEVRVRPLTDGGEGTVEALVEGMNGQFEKAEVTGPFGRKVIFTYGIIKESMTAVIEMSGAAGITLAAKTELNPLEATTYGVGEVIKDALLKGCRRFIIGIGGSATNDGGIGMLQALGFEILNETGDQVALGAKGLKDICSISDGNIIPELRESKFMIACDVRNPLCGSEGCSAVYGPQKGASPSMIKDMDNWLEDYIKDADLVVTGEGMLDPQTAMGKATVGVSGLAKSYSKTVIAFAGSVTADAHICNEKGIDAYFPIVRGITTLDEAMRTENAVKNLSDTAEQIMRLIQHYA